jgi:hypothetical protein
LFLQIRSNPAPKKSGNSLSRVIFSRAHAQGEESATGLRVHGNAFPVRREFIRAGWPVSSRFQFGKTPAPFKRAIAFPYISHQK